MIGYQLAHLNRPSEVLPEALTVFTDELSMLPFSTSSSMSDIIHYLIECPSIVAMDIELKVFQRPIDNFQEFFLQIITNAFHLKIYDNYVKDANLSYDYIPNQFEYYKDPHMCKRKVFRSAEILEHLPLSLKKLTIDDIIKIASDRDTRFDIREYSIPLNTRKLTVKRFHDSIEILIVNDSVAKGHEWYSSISFVQQYPITYCGTLDDKTCGITWQGIVHDLSKFSPIEAEKVESPQTNLKNHPCEITNALIELVNKIPNVNDLTIADMAKVDNATDVFCKKSSTNLVHSLCYKVPNPVNVDVRIVNVFEKEFDKPASASMISDFHSFEASFSECHLTLPQLISYCYARPECFITASSTSPSGFLHYTTIKIRYFYSYIIISGYTNQPVSMIEPRNTDIYADVSKFVLNDTVKKSDSIDQQKEEKMKGLSDKEKKHKRNAKYKKKEKEFMKAAKSIKESQEKEELYPVSFGRDGNGGTLMLPFKPETPIQEVLQSFDFVLAKEKNGGTEDTYIISHHFLNNGIELIINRDFKK